MKKSTIGLALLVLCASLGGGAWWWQQRGTADAVQYRSAKIERGRIASTVSASGAVSPVTQVSVGTQVSGQLKELFVDFNSEVRAGQLIAQIDPETFEYRVRQSQADVDAARAAVLTAQANVAAAQAAVSRTQLDVAEAQRTFERNASLVEKQFIAQSEADKAKALVGTTTEQVKSAQAQLAVAQAQTKSAQANVQQREAALAQAKIDLERTRILSPVNGIVIKRAVEKGQTVAASLQAPELFVIAQNLSDMQVDASIDEADVGRIRTGQKASFTVDAFPGQTFEGDVRQVRKAAQTVANVVTYVAVVAFQNTGGRLLPGMTANVRVTTDVRENVLKVPNAALRVRIAGVEPAGPGASAPSGTGPAPAGAASGVPAGTQGKAGGFSLFSPAYAQPSGSGGPGGGLAAMRERLVSELNLSADQQAKLDGIAQEMRPQFMQLRDMDDAERGAARDKIMADMRQKISAMLSPEQRQKYEQMRAASRGAAAGANTAPPATPQSAPAPGSAAAANTPPGKNATKNIANNVENTPASDQKRLKDGAAEAPSPALRMGSAGGAAAPAIAAAPSASTATPAQVGQAANAPGAAGGAGSASGAGPSGPGGGGPLAEFRNRLVSELQLTPDQQSKVEAIYSEARPRFMQLRDLPEEERGKARERILADLRARVGDVLTPEQKPKYQAMLAEAASRTSTRGRIYLLGADNKPVAYNVRLGITDGSSTELLVSPNSPNANLLVEGATVIIGTAPQPGSAPAGGARASGAPSGPRLPF
jgi:HlyD family secretion protein